MSTVYRCEIKLEEVRRYDDHTEVEPMLLIADVGTSQTEAFLSAVDDVCKLYTDEFSLQVVDAQAKPEADAKS